ncbi:MAG: hypothetical protein NZ534_09885, partial [Bacteroidia bacterium]|nr:hypothetical protein [Bacteroidia bacterium]
MRTRTFWAVAAATASVLGCIGGKSALKIRSVGFGDEVAPLQNLTFKFNRRVSKPSKEWITTVQYIRFEPPAAGAFRWLSEDELAFSPAEGFLPATAYTASLNVEAFKSLVGEIEIEAEPMQFRTPELQIVECDFYWTEGGRTGKRAGAAVAIRFNYPVSPKDLQKFLTARHDSKSTDVYVSGSEQAAIVDAVLPSVPAAPGKSEDLTLDVGAGMPVPGSKSVSRRALSFAGVLHDPGEMVLLRTEQEHNGAEGVIRLYFSQTPVAGATVSVFQAAESYWDDPTRFANFKTATERNYIELRGPFNPDLRYEITVEAGLTGAAGARTPEALSTSVAFSGVGKYLQFAAGQGIYLCAKGEKNIGLEIAGIDSLRLKIIKIYQNNLVPYLNLHFYSNPESQSFNYGTYNVEVWGDVIVDKAVETKFLPQKGHRRFLHWDFDDAKTDYKGVYLAAAFDQKEFWNQAARMVVLTDLGIIARQSEGEAMVWVQSLSTTRPVSGANVKLISHNNQTIAEGKTDSDGAAKLAIKDRSFRPAMVLVEKGQDFNFLFYSQTAVETSRFDLTGKPTRGRPYDAFLYGERNLYRPGETVHIQAVIRDFERKTPS